jgi:tRNA (guanine-N7-)-methyltransferase
MNRVPVHHPEFRYSTSRNPYAQKLGTLPPNLVLSDHAPETFRGRWRELAPSPQSRVHVEIGCNAGHVVLKWAELNPQDLFIGIDWKFKIIYRAAEKAVERRLRNVIFLRAHAERLPFIFAPGEVDALALYFPDPWPKKAQSKNRFFSARSLEDLHPLLGAGGEFHVKTDHAAYFAAMEAETQKVAKLWSVRDKTHDLHAAHPNPRALDFPDVTLFEKLFIKDGIPIHSMKLTPTPRP